VDFEGSCGGSWDGSCDGSDGSAEFITTGRMLECVGTAPAMDGKHGFDVSFA